MAITERVLTGNSFTLSASEEASFVASNPKSWLTYAALGDLRKAENKCAAAIDHYQMALTLPVSSMQEKEKLEDKLVACS